MLENSAQEEVRLHCRCETWGTQCPQHRAEARWSLGPCWASEVSEVSDGPHILGMWLRRGRHC